jgi:beta-1,4-mannosyl-glycoprotein beta-1,4-N-acetylglucosaminyltransferase
LDLRLHELDGYVDKFVICEYPITLDHVPQPLHYEENKDRFSDFHNKIIHYIGPASESISGYDLYCHRKSRDFSGVLAWCKPNDIIINTCPDIILKKQTIVELEKLDMSDCNAQLISDWFIYYMDFHYMGCKFDQNPACFHKNITPQMWETVGAGIRIGHVVQDAGYHFAKLGGVDRILKNLTEGYPLRWLNNAQINNRDVMIERMQKGYAWDSDFGGVHKPKDVVMEKIPYNPANYPDYVNQHPEIYEKYFIDGMKV